MNEMHGLRAKSLDYFVEHGLLTFDSVSGVQVSEDLRKMVEGPAPMLPNED